jgi:hypothetical protein
MITLRSSVLTTLYVTCCVGVSGLVLGSFVQIVERFITARYDYWTEMFFVIAQVPFQWIFMRRLSWRSRWRYALIALGVSLAGSIALLPLLLYHRLYGVSPLAATTYFLGVVAIIFVLHALAIARERLPRILTFTWVVYRLGILAFLLIPRGLGNA